MRSSSLTSRSHSSAEQNRPADQRHMNHHCICQPTEPKDLQAVSSQTAKTRRTTYALISLRPFYGSDEAAQCWKAAYPELTAAMVRAGRTSDARWQRKLALGGSGALEMNWTTRVTDEALHILTTGFPCVARLARVASLPQLLAPFGKNRRTRRI